MPKQQALKKPINKRETQKAKSKIKAPMNKKVTKKRVPKPKTDSVKKNIGSRSKKMKSTNQQPTEQTSLIQRVDGDEKRAQQQQVDIVFCLDTTDSMQRVLDQCKDTVLKVLNRIQEQQQGREMDVKFGFVCYRDHPPQANTYVTKMKDLCTEKEIIKFILKQDTSEGGDIPEAALDGLFVAAKDISWRQGSQRYIFHICDAPPHGKQFGIKSFWSDGVPSGVTVEQVANLINTNKINYRLIRIGERLEKMANIFNRLFDNYLDIDLEEASLLGRKISYIMVDELFKVGT